jgi:hypothetical protein
MKVSLEIKGEDVELFIVKTSETDYVRLAIALLERLTDLQLKEIINLKNTNRFLIYTDLLAQFLFKGLLCKEKGKCICGACIANKYLIENTATNEKFVVGSVCKDNWCLKDCFSYYCQFCDKKKSNGEDCGNCQGKKHLRSIFNSWKSLTNDKVDFGKFKGMSYYRLVDKQPLYCKWILTESNVQPIKKQKLSQLLF